MSHRPLLRAASVACAGTVLVGATALAADAHVRVYTYTPAVQGGDAALVFRVPSEETTDTVGLTVSLPADATIPSVDVAQKAGWTVSVTHRTLTTPITTDDGAVTSVVSSVTWTAAKGAGIPPDSYDEFDLSTEGLPMVASIAFPTVQTYANGDVVRWIEPTPASGEEPDHPIPVLALAPAGTTADAPSAAAPTDGASAAAPADGASVSAASRGTDDGTARGLGIAGIVVGAVGILAAGGAVATRRRTGPGR